MAPTVGEFILEKLCNMAAWIERETGQAGLAARMQSLTPLQAIVLAQYIKSVQWAVEGRDWAALQEQLEREAGRNPVAKEICAGLCVVRESVAMHDKFWRYMQLFCNAA
jgi:acyl carrier protein phosphodiesterase